MKPDTQFVGLPKEFWANIRTISQKVGYTQRPKRQKGVRGQVGPIRVPSYDDIKDAILALGLSPNHLVTSAGKPTKLGKRVVDYFAYRAETLNSIVEPLLMDAEQAERLFGQLKKRLRPKEPIPMNRQKKEKKRPAYFTGIVNMLIEANVDGLPCNYDPQELTTVTHDNSPFRTLSRRIDGAFPGPVNPIAVWEIKEYYYTTTFGSRVADGVYESLLDGMELEELRSALKKLRRPDRSFTDVKHYLMVDAHFTWWVKGRSYLCRLIDMLHMGFLDEVLFGKEVEIRLPEIVKEWVRIERKNRTA